VKIFRISDGKLIRKYVNSDGKIVSAKYNPEGNLVLISLYNGNIIKWDPFTGRNLGKFIANDDLFYLL
jgi:WD40 repeat protein